MKEFVGTLVRGLATRIGRILRDVKEWLSPTPPIWPEPRLDPVDPEQVAVPRLTDDENSRKELLAQYGYLIDLYKHDDNYGLTVMNYSIALNVALAAVAKIGTLTWPLAFITASIGILVCIGWRLMQVSAERHHDLRVFRARLIEAQLGWFGTFHEELVVFHYRGQVLYRDAFNAAARQCFPNKPVPRTHIRAHRVMSVLPWVFGLLWLVWLITAPWRQAVQLPPVQPPAAPSGQAPAPPAQQQPTPPPAQAPPSTAQPPAPPSAQTPAQPASPLSGQAPAPTTQSTAPVAQVPIAQSGVPNNLRVQSSTQSAQGVPVPGPTPSTNIGLQSTATSAGMVAPRP